MTGKTSVLDDWHVGVPHDARTPTMVGLAVLIFGGVGFGLWAAYAPLEGAVISAGSFVATGQNKKIQHLEGGIVRDILVQEGDTVEKGQILLRLDETAPKASLRRLTMRHHRLVAMSARLRAESSLDESIAFPDSLVHAAGDPEVREILDRQRDEMRVRRSKHDSEVSVYKKEIAGLQEIIAGYKSLANATHKRRELFAEELEQKQNLFKRNLTTKSAVLSLQRSEMQLVGEAGQLESKIYDAMERIGKAEKQIAHLQSVGVQRAVEELAKVESELDDIKEQMRATQDVVSRTEVGAPVRGIVVKLNQHTSRGVIAPGSVIMELLPINEKLMIEARIEPSDISHVHNGQEALVRINALNQRLTPMIEAKVTYVSADTVVEQDPRKLSAHPTSRQGAYVVRAQIDTQDLRVKAGDFQPTPGMPVDIFIKTGKRTFFSYLLKPIMDSFSRAFREQ